MILMLKREKTMGDNLIQELNLRHNKFWGQLSVNIITQ